MGLGRLYIAAPTVHVEHERGEGLPLVVTRGDDRIAAEDAVHVGTHVGVTRKGLPDERGDVEANVLPVAARLVARPDAGEALRSRPAVKRDDIGTVMRLLGHDIIGALDAVERHGIAVADPGDVGLEGGHTAALDLVPKIAQELPLRVGIAVRGEIGLRPQAGGNALARSVIRELLEILDVRGNGVEALLAAGAIGVHTARLCITVLTVTRTIAVIGQEITQRHIVVHVAIQTMARGELGGEIGSLGDVLGLDGGSMAVQALNMRAGLHRDARAALFILRLACVLIRCRLGALDLLLAISRLSLGRPHIAVPGVVVPDIKGVLGNEDRVAGDLEVVLQQVLRNRSGGSALGGVGHEVVGVKLVSL
ncbi:hypothetical protein EVA_09275 [gut metagenome]|uniref:Uncharacterized protein n=1 Tax=gut metagenome TaxID=749906 RepID=J9G6Y5_9ZZZZ